MFDPINVTEVSLSPKIPNADQVKDFRPILIATLSARRFPKFRLIGSIRSCRTWLIHHNLTLFLVTSSDNILLATKLIKG